MQHMKQSIALIGVLAAALVACGDEAFVDPAALAEEGLDAPAVVYEAVDLSAESSIEPAVEFEVPEVSLPAEEASAPRDDTPEVGTTGAAIFGGPACRNVRIRVTNSRSRSSGNWPIRVTKVEAYSSTDDRWRSENLSNALIGYGFQATWSGRRLESLGGDLITRWKIFYRVQQSNGSFGSTVYQIDNTPDRVCQDNSTVTLTVD